MKSQLNACTNSYSTFSSSTTIGIICDTFLDILRCFQTACHKYRQVFQAYRQTPPQYVPMEMPSLSWNTHNSNYREQPTFLPSFNKISDFYFTKFIHIHFLLLEFTASLLARGQKYVSRIFWSKSYVCSCSNMKIFLAAFLISPPLLWFSFTPQSPRNKI